MKILLANPPCKKDLGNGLEQYFIRAGSRWPHSAVKRIGEQAYHLPFPFYLGYTASILRQNGFDVKVLDAVALDWPEASFIAYTRNINPDVILFETTTPTFKSDLGLARKIKKQTDAYLVMTGAHVTTFPEQTLRENSQIDYVIIGEYEFSCQELVKRLENKLSVTQLEGIACRDKGGRVIVNGRSPEITPLERLPYPAYDLFPSNDCPDIYRYWDGISLHRKTIQMHASRGCPYRCNYCLWIQVMYGSGKYRMFTAKRIVDEMEYLTQRFQAKEIYFDDDDFTISKKHVMAICEEIKKRKLLIKWSVMGDAINPDENTILAMASAGCIAMKFGVESGTPELLKVLGKPVRLGRVRKVAEWCAKYGIRTHATFTFGLLGENRRTMEETLRFARTLDTDTVQFSINTPFPGTRYYDSIVDQGFMDDNAWKNFDGQCNAVVNIPNLSAEEIKTFHQQAVGRWLMYKFRQPLWIKRQIIYLFKILRYQRWGKVFSLVRRVGNNILIQSD